MTSFSRILFSFALFANVLTQSGFAQLSVTIDSINATAFPTVSIRIVPKQGQLLKRDLPASQYNIFEDGFLQTPHTLTVPVGTRFFSVAVLIATGSTIGLDGVTAAKAAAQGIIDSLDDLNHEAALIVYNSTTAVAQTMTPYKLQLENALSGISYASGQSNKFWDGVYGALQEAVLSVNYRAVLVCSNGRDDGSQKTLTDVVNFANNNSIKVFCYGVNASGGETNLQNLSQQTGGMYSNNKDMIVQSMIDSLRGSPKYCVLEYSSDNLCRDGNARVLKVRIKEGIDSTEAQRSYDVSAGSGSVSAVFKVDTTSVTSGGNITLDILLKTALTKQRFHPATIDLTFDKAKLTLTEATTNGTILQGSTAMYSDAPSGATISITGQSLLNQIGSILRLSFKATEVTQNSVVPLGIASMVFSGGCLNPQLIDGQIKILPKTHALKGISTPKIFSWDDVKNEYIPSPGIVQVDVINIGDLPVTNAVVTFPNQTDLKFMFGSGKVATVVPSTLQPGERGSATWYVKPLPVPAEISNQYDLALSCFEGASATFRQFINIKAAGSAVRLECSSDTIRVVKGAHVPDPAFVYGEILSAGNSTSPSGTVTIEWPPDLTLTSGNATEAFSALPTGQSQTMSWSFSYPTDQPAKDYTLKIAVDPSTGANDTCLVTLRIPELSGPVVTAACITAPANAHYDETKKSYDPLNITGKVFNTGTASSDTITARLTLAPSLALASGEMIQKTISAGLAAGDSADVSWVLNVALISCIGRTDTVRYSVFHNAVEIFSCTVSIQIPPRSNTPPEIRSKTPAQLDTLKAGSTQDFNVTVTDTDGDPISYNWYLNGVPVGSNQPTYSSLFGANGQQHVRCVVRDNCSEDSVEVSWIFFVSDLVTVEQLPGIADDFALVENYPNPFKPSTMIEFAIAATGQNIRLDILDVNGQVVRLLVNETLARGRYGIHFDALGLPGGIYFARLRCGSLQQIRSMYLLR